MSSIVPGRRKTAVPAVTPLNQPTGLTTMAISSPGVTLNWNDTNSNEGGYEIQRSVGGPGSWSSIVTTAADVTTYNDEPLTNGQTYYYRIRAVGGPGGAVSAWSSEVSESL